ncbi:MAG: 4-hydroxy-tetrahydrodipicolinate synthase [Gemmatales bacterium]|nr:4-hydroxy-tetrahydrodipicolinate synthase [Gemmatales bacterium]MDW8386757.1 4-hydroxy-tetrahydrodipicolinate synthase [Gemmatales bacterium]
MKPLHGIIPPVATPMHSDEELDLPRLRWYIDRLLSEGVHAVFVLGTNSEFYALDDREKQAVIATAVEHVAGRAPVYAGTGAESTREVIRLTRMAEREGVDAVSIITPYFISPSQKEILDHYRRIADSTSLPIILYSNPVTCGGLKIEVETVARLAEDRRFIGIKDSSGDLTTTLEYIRVTPPGFAVLQGRDTLIYSSLQFGAKGAIPASGNVAPALCVEIYDAFQRGDHDAAREAQWRLNPIRLSLGLGTPPSGVKAALDLMGLSIGPCRAPVGPLPPDKLHRMREILKQAGLINERSPG